ncbi:hypothetical protein [uncultured Psychromonas sp.]|nr:hypothetical protein [uncultured Psychromonas sp.]
MIVGCGPAGLTMARQLSEFNDITTCIADLEDGPLHSNKKVKQLIRSF